MLYPCITDTLSFTPIGTLSSLAAVQTVSARIKQERKRLEGIIVIVGMTSGAACAANHDGYAGIVKSIRLKATDVLGTRNIIDVSGPALLGFTRNNFGKVCRQTFRSCSVSQIASLAQSVSFYIPIRHPIIAEPFGNLLSLPLSSNFVKDDPILEIEFHAAATVFSAGAPAAATVKAIAILRDIPDSVPYIPSELRTETFNADAASAVKSFELGSVGFLTQALIQGYSAQTYGNAVTRVSMLTSGGLLSVEYGRNAIRKFDDDFIMALNDLTQDQFQAVAADNLTNRQFAGEYFLDFLSDHPGNDSFSAASVVNLNTEALGGDKCRIKFDQMPLNTQAKITSHKLLARTVDAIKPLMVSI